MSGPDAAAWGLVPHAERHVRKLLQGHAAARITSGRRSALRNRLVGGARNSYHLRGRAVDVVAARPLLLHLLSEATRDGAVEAMVEYPGTPREHLHVAW